MKKLLVVCGLLLAFGTISLVLFAACVIPAGRALSFTQDEQASRQETHALPIEAGRTLRIELPGGDVRIRTGEGAPSVAARITAWGETQAEAQEALGLAKLEIESSAGGTSIRLGGAVREQGLIERIVQSTAKADLEVVVPAGVRLHVESGSGDVDAVGPFAGGKVHSAYGSVRVEEVDGDLAATSSSGDVSVAKASGKTVEARSGYGKVLVADCESGRIEAQSNSGDVRVEDARAERFQVGSGYGDVELSRLTGEVEAKTSSGDVSAKELAGPAATLSTSYGRIQVDRGEGRLSAESSSGDVRVQGFRGSVEARSGYGTVHVGGVLSAVQAHSSSGDVSVAASAGSEVASTWKIGSNYGRGLVEVPEDLAFEVDARTSYGKIERGFPVELEPGSNDRGGEVVQGKVRGGGGRIEIRCKSGDVVFRPIGR